MRKTLERYYALFSANLQEAMVYRFAFFTNFLAEIVKTLVMLEVWIAVYKQRSTVAGFDYPMMVTYLLVSCPGILGDGQHQCHDSDAEYFGIRQISYRDLREEIAGIFDLCGTLCVCRLLSRRISSWNGSKPDLLVWPCGRRSAGGDSGGAVLEIRTGAVSERRGMIYSGRRDYFFTTGIHTSYRAF